MPTLRLIEPYRNLFYSTLYAARHKGFFEELGLDVEVRTRFLDEDVLDSLRRDEADVVLTGPMRLLLDADAGQTDLARNFIEVNSRDGFMLLARSEPRRFEWSQLEGKTIVAFRDPPTPWMCLLRVLQEQGVNRERVEIETYPSLPAALDAFQAGDGDFIEAPEPLADDLIESGQAHLATPMGLVAGHLAFTSFAALPRRLDERRLDFMLFTRAIYAAERWMAASAPEAVAEAALEFLPDDPVERLVRGVKRYKSQATWAQDPLLRRAGFERLRDILHEGGLVRGIYRYEDQVDTTLAEAVLAEAD